MEITPKHVHDAEVRKIQEAIGLKQLSRGVVITREVVPGHFEMKVYVVPIVPPNQIDLQIDLSKLDDDDERMTFRDLGM